MALIVDLFYAFFLSGCGYLILKYRRNVKSWTGNFAWAEHYLGSGGTYIVLTLLGLFLIFLGVLYPFGGLELITGSDSSTIQPLGN